MFTKFKISRNVALAVTGLCVSLFVSSEEDSASLVTVEMVRQDTLAPKVWLAGNLINRLDSRISAEQSGRLLWILDVGAQVITNQVIAKLDDRELQLQLAERHVQLKRQAANIEYYEKQQTRLRKLLHNNSTSMAELDRVERDLKLAIQDSAATDVQIRQIQLAIDKAQIKAPFAGSIRSRLAQQGEYVSAGSLLLRLVDPKSLDISVAAPLSLAPYLGQNSHVQVKWQDQQVDLPIKSWSPAGNSTTRTFEVLVDASPLSLLSGSSVSVSLPSGPIEQTKMVPRDALLLRGQQNFVVLVDEDSKSRRIEVEIGRGHEDWIAVNGALQYGDNVVIRGGERLKDGEKVRLSTSIAAISPLMTQVRGIEND